MAATSILPGVSSNVVSAPSTVGSGTSSTATSTKDVATSTIAGNFQTFLTLLTTQLKNQNPLDPLDTNQFTQQLVQFAQVEQQLKSNDQLTTLVSLQKTAQSTQALTFVGQTVGVDGSTAQLSNGQAQWNLSIPQAAAVSVSIQSATGQTVYTGSFNMNSGNQQFVWDGRDAAGTKWPDGNYTLTATAKDINGKPVGVATEVEGPVDSVDLTQNPPLLSVSGQNYTLDKIKRVVRSH